MFTPFRARPSTETSIEFRFVERRDYTKARRLQRFPHPLERRRPGHSHPEASQGGVCEVALERCVPNAKATSKSDYPVTFFACFLTFAHRFFAALAMASLPVADVPSSDPEGDSSQSQLCWSPREGLR